MGIRLQAHHMRSLSKCCNLLAKDAEHFIGNDVFISVEKKTITMFKYCLAHSIANASEI